MKQSNKYHKIMSIYMRSDVTHKFLMGQYATPEIGYLKDNQWLWTEKVDGTNVRIMWDGKDIKYGGRADDSQMPLTLVQKLDELFKTPEKRAVFISVFGEEEQDTVLYGEGYGNKIQKGGDNYIKDGVDFVLFDVKVEDFLLEREGIEDVGVKFGLKVVPIIGRGTIDQAIEKVKKGFTSQWGDFIAEGLVLKPTVELFTRKGDRIITKVKYKDFK